MSVEEAATTDEFLTRELILQEVNRWRQMNVVARTIYEGLPPAQQETIRVQGQSTIVPLGALVGTDPARRELASTILDQLAELLSHPLVTIEPTFGSNETSTGTGMAEDDELGRRLDAMDDRIVMLSADVRELTETLTRLEELIRAARAVDPPPNVSG